MHSWNVLRSVWWNFFSNTVTNATSISSRGLKGDGGARTVPVEGLMASRALCKEISVGELPAKVDHGGS